MKLQKNIIYIIFFIYIIFVISVTFFPIRIGQGIRNINNYINLIPFRVFYDDLILIERGIAFQVFKQTFGNFILLLPAGFLIPIIWKDFIKNYKKAFLVGFLISFFIELLQFILTIYIFKTHYKIADIDDIILNTSGFILGFFIFKKFFEYKILKK